jgi:aromatic ring-opening dioxygenase catalytic subunit (LigB family)
MHSDTDESSARALPLSFPSLYIPHGGGPCFFMDWPGEPHMWDEMGIFLSGLGKSITSNTGRPKAIVVISAHWEEADFTVTSNPQPPLLFDYYGFPAHTYELKYPAPGAPELALRIQSLLKSAGLPANLDAARGFDHGVFIPFLLAYPEADIPIVQLSLKAGLDPATHICAGKALASLRNEGVLIVGSGMSFHNMQGFFKGGFATPSRQFDQWLESAALLPRADARNAMLEHWAEAPGAQASHPRAEHLLPLMVVAGTAGEHAGRKIFEGKIKDAVISAFSFD